MKRLDAMRAVYSRLEDRIVVTIMGACAAELQSLGHRPNFFYLQHAMGLASSMGLGIALARPDRQVVVFDGDGSILMNLGGLTTLARYRPRNLVHVVFDNESLLSVGGFPTATATGASASAPPIAARPSSTGLRRTTASRSASAATSAASAPWTSRSTSRRWSRVTIGPACGPTSYRGRRTARSGSGPSRRGAGRPR